MERKTKLTKDEWLQIEEIVAKIVDEDAWDMCSRPFINGVEQSIDNGDYIEISTSAGGDHFPIPLSVQAIPFALSGVREAYMYYKQHGSLPSTAEEFISLIPKTQKEVKEFIINNFPMLLSLIIYGLQIV